LENFRESCSHHRAEIKTIYELARYVQRFYTPVLFLRLQDNGGNTTGESLSSILSLLKTQSFRRTTDPRDKTYALVGLVPWWRNGGLKVNYRLSVRQVYAAAVKAVAEQYNTLDSLVDSFAIPSKISLAELPSWCPDWSKVVHTQADEVYFGQCSPQIVLFE
jgi:hypothetical protein